MIYLILLFALLAIIILKLEVFITGKEHRPSTYIRTYLISATVLWFVLYFDLITFFENILNLDSPQIIQNINEPIIKEN